MSSILSIDGLSSQRVLSTRETPPAKGTRDDEATGTASGASPDRGWGPTEGQIPPVPPTYSPASAQRQGFTQTPEDGTDPQDSTPELSGNAVLLVIAILKNADAVGGADKPVLDIRA